jgi:hypothetical protein
MCKKLMFLISFVALLGLTNGAFARDWDGGGATNSFCDAENWEDDVVPVDETARADGHCDPNDPEGKDIVIDCDVSVGDLRMPAYDPPGGCTVRQNLDIVSGNIVAENWRAIYKGDANCVVNATGGSLTITDDSSSTRLTDDGYDVTYAFYNFGGSFVMDLNGRVRSGDNGGNVFISFSDDVIFQNQDYFRIGDDGGGKFSVSGNASVTNLSDGYGIYFPGRQKSTAIDISGGETWTAGPFQVGQGDKPGAKDPASVDMTMSGGTINCSELRVGDGIKYADGSCSLVMTGGLIVCREEMKVGGDDDGSATVSVEGGEIRIESGDSLEIDTTGQVDVCGGVIKIKGNVMADIGALACDGTGRLTGCGEAAGVVLAFDGTYTVVTGTTEVDPKKAYCPVPANGAAEVQSVVTEVVLCWQPGTGILDRGRHLVYFGTDPAAVAAMGPGEEECVNRALELCCNVGNLPLWTEHCWRVDEFNEDGTTTTGDVWCFTTGCAAIPGDMNQDCLVNFEDYACVAGDFGEEQFWPED